MTEDPTVRAWLADHGLEDYVARFVAGDVDAATLPHLTADDLVALGITSVGHRRRLLLAIAQLDGSPPAPPSSGAPAAPWSDGDTIVDRRHLTILFCDLVGSTTLSRQCDPEELGGMFREFFDVMGEIIARYDGYEANRLGDGSLVFFGYPIAQEDAALRAVHTARDMVREFGERVRTPLGAAVEVCVGMASGVVVIDRADEKNVFGDTPNVAARVQGLAQPGEILLADSTARLVRNELSLASAGEHALKGLGAPMRVWRVPSGTRAESTVVRRPRVPVSHGREAELSLAAEAWRHAVEGRGRTLLVTGEAGIGKSHLVEDVVRRCVAEGAAVRRYQCSAFHRTNVFWPFRRELGDARATGDTTVVVDPVVAEATPSEARARRERAIEGYVRRALAVDGPTVLRVDDLHWADPSSLEVLERVSAGLHDRPILLLVSSRTPAADLVDVVPLELGPLPFAAIDAILRDPDGVLPLPDDVIAAIIDRADGVPLFAEEMARSVEHALLDGHVPTVDAVPATLQDSLQARIDRLGAGAEMVRVAAVLGREVPMDFLAAMLPDVDDGRFAAALTELSAAGLVDSLAEGAAVRRPCVSFRHQLVRDCAYDAILLTERRELHARAAAMLATRVEVSADARAFHEERAGHEDAAAFLWAEAGRHAAERMAHAEAVEHFDRALTLLTSIEPTARDEFEIATLLAQLPCTIGSAGYVDSVAAPVARVVELTRSREDPGPAFRAMFLRWIQYLAHGQVDLAHDFGQGLSDLAVQIDDPVARLVHDRMTGSTALFRGDLDDAEAALERFVATHRPDEHGEGLAQYGATDNWTTVQCCRIALAGLRGDADRRDALLRPAMSQAEARKDPHNLCHAIAYGGAVSAALLGDHDAFRAHAAQLARLAERHELPFWDATATIFRAVVDVLDGDGARGHDRFFEGAAWFADVGAGFLLPTFRVVYASAAALRPSTMLDAELLRLLHQSLADGERWVEPEIVRLRGVRAAMDGHDDQAVSLLQAADRLAVAQGSWSVRGRIAASITALSSGDGDLEKETVS